MPQTKAALPDAMSRHPLPVTFEEVPAEVVARHSSRGFCYKKKMVRTVPGRFSLSEAYLKLADAHYNFEFRSSDVVLLSYPKSGTTWASELLWAMMNIDHLDSMEKKNIHGRAFYLDKDFAHPIPEEDLIRFRQKLPDAKAEEGVILQLAAAEKGPRLLWSHMPLLLLNPDMLNTCKVVYVARNPKDVCVSAFHFISKLRFEGLKVYQGEFSDFAEVFMDDSFMMMPYWEHIQQAWQQRDHEHLHIMFYEDMKKDLMGELRKLNLHLMTGLTEQQLRQVSEAASFDRLKSLEAKMPIFKAVDGSFFRKGQTGDWKNIATSELDIRMDRWIQEKSRMIGITFQYS
nr:sulfotransferase 1C4-like isoform X1 [Penaeus vannamei]